MSAFLSILCLFLIVWGTVFLFSNQILQLTENLTDFRIKILNIFAEATLYINKNIEFLPQLKKGELLEKIHTRFNESSGRLLSQTLSSTANIIFGIVTTIIFTFLILIYRKGIIRALVSFFYLSTEKNPLKCLNLFSR